MMGKEEEEEEEEEEEVGKGLMCLQELDGRSCQVHKLHALDL